MNENENERKPAKLADIFANDVANGAAPVAIEGLLDRAQAAEKALRAIRTLARKTLGELTASETPARLRAMVALVDDTIGPEED